ncbi:hypothetical protein Tco_1383872 [Tanacetum coccineum]
MAYPLPMDTAYPLPMDTAYPLPMDTSIHHEDVVDHIAMVLEMLDLINIPDGKDKSPLGKNLLRNFSVNSTPNHTMEKKKCWTKEINRGLIHLNSYHEIKDEYEDLTSTSKGACRAYQEIFCMMDEGWMATETSSKEAEEKSNLKTSLLTKVLPGRQAELLFIFIESVFPDINTAYPLHTIRRIECLDVISPLFLCTLKTLLSVLSIRRIQAHDTAYSTH